MTVWPVIPHTKKSIDGNTLGLEAPYDGAAFDHYREPLAPQALETIRVKRFNPDATGVAAPAAAHSTGRRVKPHQDLPERAGAGRQDR